MHRLERIASHLSPPQVQGERMEAATAQPTSAGNMQGKKVAVLGAAGGIGQPLSLLMKLNPRVRELSLYDVVNTPGVGADLSHIDSIATVKAYVGPEQLGQALYGCDLVLIPAGVPRKPGMTRDDLFNINAGIVKTLCEGIAQHCPQAWVGIISNPVNSTVPIAAEVFRRAGTYNPTKLFGVTTLDVVRAQTFVGQAVGVDPATVDVPVIGGHAGITILPLLSQAQPRLVADGATLQQLTARIQDAGTEVVKAKAGAGSATLSMAYAAYRFGEMCLLAMEGAPVRLCAYVESALLPGLPYFASPLVLGPNGIAEFLPLGELSGAEKQALDKLKPELQASIAKGIEFVAKGGKK